MSYILRKKNLQCFNMTLFKKIVKNMNDNALVFEDRKLSNFIIIIVLFLVSRCIQYPRRRVGKGDLGT